MGQLEIKLRFCGCYKKSCCFSDLPHLSDKTNFCVTDGGETQQEETEHENKTSDQHLDPEQEQENKQKQTEESHLDGGMEEEQKHHEAGQQDHDEQQPTDDNRRQETEMTDGSESKEEEKSRENDGQTNETIEQVLVPPSTIMVPDGNTRILDLPGLEWITRLEFSVTC